MSLDASSKNENAFFREYYRPDTPEYYEKNNEFLEKYNELKKQNKSQ